MNDVPAASHETTKRERAFRRLRRHTLVYATVICALFLIDLLTPGPWWFLWPMIVWGVALAAYWLYLKSVYIDEIWAQQRTEDIRLQAHDLGHIEDIQMRYEKAEARRRSGAGPPDKNHIETVRESYEKLASQSKGMHTGDGEAEPDESSENRS